MAHGTWQRATGGFLLCAVFALAGASAAQAAPPPPKFPWMKQSQSSQQSPSAHPSQQGAKQSAQPSGHAADPRKTGIDKKGLGQKLKDTLGDLYDKTQKAATAGPQSQQPSGQQVGTLQSVCDFYKLALKKHYGKTDDGFVNLLLGHSYLIAADMTLLNKIDWLNAGTLEAKCALLDTVYGYEGEVEYKATGEIKGNVTGKKSGYQTIEKGLGTNLNPLEVGEYLAVTTFAEESYKCQNMTDFGDKCLFNLDALKKMDSQVDPEILLGMQKPQKGGAPSAGGEGCYYKDQNMANPFGFCSAGNVSEDVPSDEKMGNPMGGTASVEETKGIGPGGGGSKIECGGVVDCEEGETDPPGAEFFMLPGMSQICGINEMAMGGGTAKLPTVKEARDAFEKAKANVQEKWQKLQEAKKEAKESAEKEKQQAEKGGHPGGTITPGEKKVGEAEKVLDEALQESAVKERELMDAMEREETGAEEEAGAEAGAGAGAGAEAEEQETPPASSYNPGATSNAGPCDKFMQKVQNGLGLMCAALNKEAPIVKSNEDGTPVGFVGSEFYKGNKGEACTGLIIGKAPVDILEGGGPGAYCCDVSKAGFLWKKDPGLGVTDPSPQDQTTMGGAGEPGAPAAAGTSSATPDGGASQAEDSGAQQQQLPADQGGQGEPGTDEPPAGGGPGGPGTP